MASNLTPPLLPLRRRVKTVAKAQEDLLLHIDQFSTEVRELRLQLNSNRNLETL